MVHNLIQCVKWSHASIFFNCHNDIIQHPEIERMAIGDKEYGFIICIPYVFANESNKILLLVNNNIRGR